MPDTSPNLNLPLIAPSQAMKHVTHNEALVRLDAITQLSVEAFGATIPPATPQEGECYGIGAVAQNAWLGHDGEIGVFSNGGWLFVVPQPGWRAWDLQNAGLMVFTASQWLEIDLTLNNVDGVGINASYDTVNRLTLASEASLFSHDGAGHQLKINKATDGDTASLLFQSGFTGHAEIGLAGDNDLAFKVSNDGTNFVTGLNVRNTDGMVEVPSLRSGRVLVPDDNAIIIPTPGEGGIIIISMVNPSFPQTLHSGMFAYDSGASLSLTTLAKGSKVDNLDSATLSGTTGLDGRTSIAMTAGGIQLENRISWDSFYAYTFLNTY
jgi:hypothetical protein